MDEPSNARRRGESRARTRTSDNLDRYPRGWLVGQRAPAAHVEACSADLGNRHVVRLRRDSSVVRVHDERVWPSVSQAAADQRQQPSHARGERVRQQVAVRDSGRGEGRGGRRRGPGSVFVSQHQVRRRCSDHRSQWCPARRCGPGPDRARARLRGANRQRLGEGAIHIHGRPHLRQAARHRSGSGAIREVSLGSAATTSVPSRRCKVGDPGQGGSCGGIRGAQVGAGFTERPGRREGVSGGQVRAREKPNQSRRVAPRTCS